MARTPDRVRVLAGVAVVLAVGYLVLVHWWWTAPMLAMGEQIAKLRDEELALRMEIAQKPALELELARVSAFEANNPGFLPETNRQLATAALVQRLEQVLSSASPNKAACEIAARTPAQPRNDEPFVRATVQVRLKCGMAELSAVLYALESGSPQLYVDNLDLISPTSYLGTGLDGGKVDVNFDLYGYLKLPGEVASD